MFISLNKCNSFNKQWVCDNESWPEHLGIIFAFLFDAVLGMETTQFMSVFLSFPLYVTFLIASIIAMMYHTKHCYSSNSRKHTFQKLRIHLLFYVMYFWPNKVTWHSCQYTENYFNFVFIFKGKWKKAWARSYRHLKSDYDYFYSEKQINNTRVRHFM